MATMEELAQIAEQYAKPEEFDLVLAGNAIAFTRDRDLLVALGGMFRAIVGLMEEVQVVREQVAQIASERDGLKTEIMELRQRLDKPQPVPAPVRKPIGRPRKGKQTAG